MTAASRSDGQESPESAGGRGHPHEMALDATESVVFLLIVERRITIA